jgi:hypothetical protein
MQEWNSGVSGTQDEWIEQDAWKCVSDSQKDWKQRSAPSRGARAKAIAGMLAFPPSYIEAVRRRIELFLTPRQLSERTSFEHQFRG